MTSFLDSVTIGIRMREQEEAETLKEKWWRNWKESGSLDPKTLHELLTLNKIFKR